MATIQEMADIIARHTPVEGVNSTTLDRLQLVRSSAPTEPAQVIVEPALCLVAQGRKQAILGDRTFVYDATKFLLVSVDLHVSGCVVEATPTLPYLCIRLELDLKVLSELVLEHDGCARVPDGFQPGLALSEVSSGLSDAAVRLLRLLDQPEDARVLAPLVEREILYRLMMSGQGAMVRHIVARESRLSQISRAIAWIKRNYAQAFSIDQVAAEAGMSPSAFHQHFKAVTAMSPLQYRTRLRLQEARRLMVAEALDAASAGYRVGYDSPSQFSRDYSRVFGAPPLRDAARLRTTDYALVA